MIVLAGALIFNPPGALVAVQIIGGVVMAIGVLSFINVFNTQ